MHNKLSILIVLSLTLLAVSCKDNPEVSPSQLTGFWMQQEVYVDDVLQTLSPGEKESTLLLESNGVYRMFDGVMSKEHAGTWIVTDQDLLSISMNKVLGKKTSDGTYSYGQILIRFTILHAGNDSFELQIKTTLGKRKYTVMFNQMADDPVPADPDEALVLDTENKKMYTYRYLFKKVNL